VVDTQAISDRRGGAEVGEPFHGMWAAVAAAWAEHAVYADARGAGLAQRMLDLVEARPGNRVLDLACGPGGMGLAAARRIAPGGEVVMSDVAAEMTAVASSRADAVGLSAARA
jgi:cyclopropane fatty-acyl-phospholipid synthase-like methyltransferase